MNSTNNGSTHGPVSHNCLIALAALSGANVIAHLIALPSLPAQMPPHWGASGEVNDQAKLDGSCLGRATPRDARPST